jgi:alpha-beta hydrolase superfamily lysophospholipase
MSIYREKKLDTDRGYHISCLSWIEDSDKELLLCVRGFGGGAFSTVVEKIAMEMKKLGIGTFSFTWPAHGNSDASGDMLTVENCLADMEDAVSHLKELYPGRKLSCFATSFGGFMAAVYHQKHPEDFEKIILRSPAVRMADIIMHFMNEEQRAAYLAGEKLNFGFGDNPLILGKAYYESLLRYPVAEMQLCRPDKFSIIQGDADEIVPPADVRNYAARNKIPVFWAEGADHQYTNPGGLDAVLTYTKQIMTGA